MHHLLTYPQENRNYEAFSTDPGEEGTSHSINCGEKFARLDW
jgi:hypothetical protein